MTPALDRIRGIVDRLPTTRDENWKYTDLAAVRDISLRWLDAGAGVPEATLQEQIDAVTSAIEANWVVMANGRITSTPAIDGLEIDNVEVGAADDSLGELNDALGSAALRLRVNGSIASPLGLLFVDDAGAGPVAVSSRVAVEVAAGCRCELIELRSSAGDGDLYANGELKLALGDAAGARVVRIQRRDSRHVETTRLAATLGEDASLEMLAVDLGGRLVRNDTIVDLASRGAHAVFNGVYLAGDGQHIDNHTRVDHRVGPTMSRQEYRGILHGRCRAVWNGKAMVHSGADGTDAQQGNHNLLLSEQAEIDTKPELEIYADDVKCAHGTTVGQLDERALFYLRSRGIDSDRARQMLTQAFAAGLVNGCPVEAASKHVAELVETRLGDLIGEDRS